MSLERVRDLIRLSGSDNENEARNAELARPAAALDIARLLFELADGNRVSPVSPRLLAERAAAA